MLKQFFQRLFVTIGDADSPTQPCTPVAPAPLPATETIGQAITRGSRISKVEPHDLSEGFTARLVDVCRADPNIVSMSLMWMSSDGAEPELFAALLFDRPSEYAAREFIGRADALGGPRFIAACITGTRTSNPFYRRSDWLKSVGENYAN